MSRRRRSKKRPYNTDPKYQSILVYAVANHLMNHGKKSLSYRILYSALEQIHTSTQKDPLAVLEYAVRMITPVVQLKSRRMGGATYQVPVEVDIYRGTGIAIKWILNAARVRPGRGVIGRLSAEIVDATRGRGGCTRKREEVHRMAEANKAFVRYRFLSVLVLVTSMI